MNVRIAVKTTVILLVIAMCCEPLLACTYFFQKAKDGSVVVGRSMEFGNEVASRLDLVPRGTSFESTAPDGAITTAWQSKYGFVAMSHHGKHLYSDGINEKGLNVSTLWFVDGSYPKPKAGEPALRNYDLCGWALSKFSTADEVAEALRSIVVWGAFNESMNMVLPFHWAVTDATGKSIVIEYVKGALTITDNSRIGVMCNSPSIDFHLTNLRCYSNLNPATQQAPEVLKEAGWALGSGLRGLPGDFTSPSRYVRVAVQKHYAPQPDNAESAVSQAIHLLNTVDQVPGVVVFGGDRGAGDGEGPPTQFTPWITVADLANKHFYYRAYDSQDIRRVDLTKMNFDSGQPYRSVDIYGRKKYVDDTARLLGGK
ncbi:MAG: linear amide C-N hydrolase [Pirellulaceae bacterium]|nr:linear amide C-N hydrolase [Pirellulaceae bacterium]